jgi:N-acetylglucosaminyldiphosphoundecaprenol N-acetyl-beta-D-mannosaminyltransferase
MSSEFHSHAAAVAFPQERVLRPDPAAATRVDAQGNRVIVMECPFDSVTFDQAVDRVIDWCRHATSAKTVVTMNAALLVSMRKDAALAAACRAGDLIVPDGVPVVWASSLVRRPLTARVAGCDLMQALLARGGREGLRVFFLGARENVVAELARRCAHDYPGLQVAGYRNGYFTDSDVDDVVAQVRHSSADIVFIGMPSPFKEIFAERHRDDFNAPVIMGVGGSFDVLAGFVKRAPASWQKVGMEWSWRLLMEPRKLWRRYLVTNTLFLAHVARDTVKSRF